MFFQHISSCGPEEGHLVCKLRGLPGMKVIRFSKACSDSCLPP